MVLGVIYNLKNPYLGLRNGQRYWGGGGGTTVYNIMFVVCTVAVVIISFLFVSTISSIIFVYF